MKRCQNYQCQYGIGKNKGQRRFLKGKRSNDAGLCSNCRKDNLKRNPSRVSHQKEAITSNEGHQHTHSATVNEISVLKHSTHLFPLS